MTTRSISSMTRKRFARLAVALVAAPALAAAGCGSDDDRLPPDDPDFPGESAALRVVHATPDAPAVDVYLDDEAEPAIAGLAYGEVSDYVLLEPGDHALAIREAGADPEGPILAASESLALGREQRFTAVAAGTIAPAPEGAEEEPLRIVVLEEGFSDPGVDRAMLRLVHASPDAAALAIDVAGSRAVDELARFDATGARGIPVAAEELTRLTLFATGDWLMRLGSYSIPPVPEGEELIVVVTGFSRDRLARDPDALSLLVVGSEGLVALVPQDPVVFVLHAVPDAASLDVSADGGILVWDIAWAELSGARQVPPGALDLTVRGNPGGAALGSATTDALERGQRYLLVLTGFASPADGEPGITAIAARDVFDASPDGAAEYEIVHAIPNAPEVDLNIIEGGAMVRPPLIESLDFGAASDPITVTPGTLDLGATPAGTVSPVLVRSEIAATEGEQAFLVLVGALAPQAGVRWPQVLAVRTDPWQVSAP